MCAYWPAVADGASCVGMVMDINALAHEIWAAAQLGPKDGIEDAVKRIVEILSPRWESGEPMNLAAAAIDADEWLKLIEIRNKQGEWKFVYKCSEESLRACRKSILSFSSIGASVNAS